MPDKRPAIPAETKRKVLLEAGHHCAVCGRSEPLELAHIVPWYKSHSHAEENLICLCANCHERADKYKWGTKMLKAYRRRPWILRQREDVLPEPEPSVTRLEINIDMELKHFDAKNRRRLQHTVAAFLSISPDDVKIIETRPGSVKVTIELPSQDASKLLIAFQRRAPDLLDHFGPLPLLDIQEAPTAPQARTLHVPFQNREDEMRDILSSFAPAYFLLDAPAGYGKSVLLERLTQRFEENDWVAAYICLDEHGDVHQLVSGLAYQLGVECAIDGLDISGCGRQLAAALKRDKLDEITRKGLVLLVDLDRKPARDILDHFVDQFIPAVQKSLRQLEFFLTRHNRFRVILAGRHLAKHATSGDIPLRILQLTPFDYKVVLETMRTLFPRDTRASVTQLAAHLMHVTGGHPGCIAHCLRSYEAYGETPDEFLGGHAEELWMDVIGPVVQHVRDNISQDLWYVFDRLSVYRYLDYGLLDALVKDEGEDFGNSIELADKLTSTFLLSWHGRLLQDDITRRLLAIRLREEEERFPEWCRQAQQICANHIQRPTTQSPEMWAIEFLYQVLQEHAPEIHDAEQRASLGERFFDKVSQALTWLLDGRQKEIELRALKEALENDWEFRFTVDYFLRADGYSDAPSSRLYTQIEELLR
jgi:hypothetical protein